MSYEPTIVAFKKDFDKHRDLILNGDWQYEGTKSYKTDQKTKLFSGSLTVMEFIRDEYSNAVSVGETCVIVMKPEFTLFNKLIRNKLDELEIKYGTRA